MNAELAPCPMCGSANVSANQLRHDERSGYNVTLTVSCNGCGVRIDVESKQDKAGWCNEKADSQFARAAAAWNRRTPPAGSVAGLVGLVADLRAYGTPDCPKRWRGVQGYCLSAMVADELEAALNSLPAGVEK